MRIRVVAGILRDSDGCVLLAGRSNDPEFNGLWEFPGGKAEPRESSGSALCRELAEELGVEVTAFDRFASVDHDYAERLVHIEFFLVSAWRNEPRPMLGQPLRWALPREVRNEEMLPANAAVLERLRQS